MILLRHQAHDSPPLTQICCCLISEILKGWAWSSVSGWCCLMLCLAWVYVVVCSGASVSYTTLHIIAITLDTCPADSSPHKTHVLSSDFPQQCKVFTSPVQKIIGIFSSLLKVLWANLNGQVIRYSQWCVSSGVNREQSIVNSGEEEGETQSLREPQ